MKLVDLLVKELPRRGGWPEGNNQARQDGDGEICFEPGGTYADFYCGEIATDTERWFELNQLRGASDLYVTKEQYESALTALTETAPQQVESLAWDGGWPPPVGVECEVRYKEAPTAVELFIFRCVAVDCGFAFGWAGKEAVTLGEVSYEFRPIRTEAERKREAAVGAMNGHMFKMTRELAYQAYDHIAAGEIPGIKLED